LKQVSNLNALKLSVFENHCTLYFLPDMPKLELSQGSVTTYRRYGGKYYMHFVGNLFLFTAMKEFLKSVKNSQSYCHGFSVLLFLGHCIFQCVQVSASLNY